MMGLDCDRQASVSGRRKGLLRLMTPADTGLATAPDLERRSPFLEIARAAAFRSLRVVGISSTSATQDRRSATRSN